MSRIIREPVIETTSKTPVLCSAGGKVLKEPVLNLPPVARTPSRRFEYRLRTAKSLQGDIVRLKRASYALASIVEDRQGKGASKEDKVFADWAEAELKKLPNKFKEMREEVEVLKIIERKERLEYRRNRDKEEIERNKTMATKKAAKRSKAKKSTAKKTATKKAVKRTATKKSDRGESWTDSIITSCGRLKGVRRYREIAEKVEARRIELKLLAKDHSNIALTQKLKSMAKNGSVTIVAPGQYSFDGSKKRLATAATTKKSAPKKTAKKRTAVKRNPVK